MGVGGEVGGGVKRGGGWRAGGGSGGGGVKRGGGWRAKFTSGRHMSPNLQQKPTIPEIFEKS